jgi:hypothetical protein
MISAANLGPECLLINQDKNLLSLFVIENMVHSCYIVGCAQRQNKAKNISLHRIPSFPEEPWALPLEVTCSVGHNTRER